MAERPLTVLFMPESAYGPTNQCVGIGDVLLRRGHRVVFAAEASWKGRLAPLGFEEDLVDLAPPAAPVEGEEPDAGAFWKEFIRDTVGGMLRTLGYEPVCARAGGEALSYFEHVRLAKRHLETEPPPDRLEDPERLGHHLGADPVARQHRDGFFHGMLFPL